MRFTIENSKSRDPFSYLPFSAGPRQVVVSQARCFCIGDKKMSGHYSLVFTIQWNAIKLCY